jgi:pimeloyl-ACP methyl ester carboxylesterase
MQMRSRRARLGLAFAVAAAVGAGRAPGASAKGLEWTDCGAPDAPAPVECAAQPVPLDYGRPGGKQLDVAVARVKATGKRIGSLLINFGGPGFGSVDFLRAGAGAGLFDALNERFDLIGFDPRGTGSTTGAVDCQVNQETQGVARQPFPRPTSDLRAYFAQSRAYVRRCAQLNPRDILEHLSTADVARDMDQIRRSLGEARISYLGFSYGTFLGTTYGRLFPNHVRGLVLDGALNADEFLSDPLKASTKQTAAFERALGRFFTACAADQAACLGFGEMDPQDAYDQLVAQADAAPIPAPRYTPDPRPVDGDTINNVVITDLYAKQYWPEIAQALAEAAAGDASLFRALNDEVVYGRDPDTGQYDPGLDRFVAISASEQNWPTDAATYLREGDQSWGSFDHFWYNHGYSETAFGFWPAQARDAYHGPFTNPWWARTPLVVGTTYDPATPYRGAQALVRELGNARLLTMRGDGHTAYGGNSACIDDAVNAYLIDRTLPPEGTVCRQEVPFAQPQGNAARSAARALTGVAARHARLVPGARPIPRD